MVRWPALVPDLPALFKLVGFARTSVCQVREAQERCMDGAEEHYKLIFIILVFQCT